MPIAGRFGPVVVLHVEFFPEIDELLSYTFDEFSWRHSSLRSRLLHFLAMLIDTGQKKYFLTLKPVIARKDIGQHHLVGVPDMWRRVRIIDCCGDEKCFRHARDTLADGDRPRNLP